jgi:hypothetical protein
MQLPQDFEVREMAEQLCYAEGIMPYVVNPTANCCEVDLRMEEVKRFWFMYMMFKNRGL